MIFNFFVLILLICINGMFSASEIAFLSINKIKLESDIRAKNKKAIKIKRLIEEPSKFLATIQIGITLAGFLASAFASESFADIILEKLLFLNISVDVLKTIIVIILTMMLSYFTLVFGELIPKRLGLYYPEKIAYKMVNIIYFLMKIAYPFVFLLTKTTNIIIKLIGIKEVKQEKLTEDEIKMIISHGKEIGAIEAVEKDLIFNIFDFNDTLVKEIMRNRSKVVHIDITINLKMLTKLLKENKYTRIPVYEGDINNIVGILNVKDIIIFFEKNTKFEIKKILRKPYFVNENDKVDDIFRKMQKDRQCMAVVKDENNKFVGIVTTEDAVEEIVGNLFNEYDELEK